MIPPPWVAVVLVLAAYRVTRLVGWDDFPLALRLRARVTGENRRRRGKEIYGDGVFYTRPTVAKLVHCAYCAGFHISVAIYILWLWFPTKTLYGAFPFALSGAVGLITKNLDP